MSTIGSLLIKLFADTTDVDKNLKGLQGQIGKLGGALAAGFAVSSLTEFSKKVIDITSEFQKFEAVLNNTLGSSSKTGAALSKISDIAEKTPFSVKNLTEGFVKLVNGGFEPTSKEIIKLGDLASSTGKDISQLVEAVLDAQTGEFERLKEFGIKAKKSGDEVTFSFKGVSTTVKNTEADIRNYLLSLGELKGVSGSMAAISETLGGKISNLGDAFDRLFNTIGNSGDSILKRGINNLTKYINLINDFIKTDKQKQSDAQNSANSQSVEFLKSELSALQKNIQEKEKLNVVDAEAKAITQERVQLNDRLLNTEQALADQRAKTANLAKLEGKRGRGFEVDGQLKASRDTEKELLTQINSYKFALEELDSIESKNQDTKSKGIPLSAEQVKLNEKIASTYNNVLTELSNIDKQQNVFVPLGEGINFVDEKQKVLLDGIKNLISLGLNEESKAVQNLVGEYQKLAAIDVDKIDPIDNSKKIDKQIPKLSAGSTQLGATTVLSSDTTKQIEDLKGKSDEAKSSVLELGNALSSSLSSAISSFAVSVGQAIAAGADLGSIFNSLLGIVADFAVQFGQAVIATGVAALALKASFANPVAAIAAGTALVLAGTIAKSLLSNLGNSKPKNSFAGGYSAGLPHDMIAQVHKGEKIVPANFSASEFLSGIGLNNFGGGEVRFVLEGDVVAGVLKRVENRTGRLR